MQESWGYHLLLDCRGGNVETVRSHDAIEAFVGKLVDAIGMKAYGDPQIVHFAEHDENAGGYTLIQLIETSAITGHFVDLNGDFYLDVFSCRHFNDADAIAVVQQSFQPDNIKAQFVERNAR